MVVIICGKYGNNRTRTENVTERTRFSMSRSNDLEDISQGQRSSHATHLLMLVIICTKYGKNPSRTVDATERTRFSKSRANDLEDIGQGQSSSNATHLFMLVIICIKYGKNPSRTVDATERTRFSRPSIVLASHPCTCVLQRQLSQLHTLKLPKFFHFHGDFHQNWYFAHPKISFAHPELPFLAKSMRPRPNDLEDIGQGQRSLYATHSLILVIICIKYGKNPSRTVDFFFQGQGRKFF